MTVLRIRGSIREIAVAEKGHGRLADIMPNFVAHAGQWQGKHLHFSTTGCLLETHTVFLEHAFPASGGFAHVQTSRFSCEDGQEHELVQKSILRDDRLCWNNGTFKGCIWEADHGIILLNMHQIEYPNICLNEMICLEPDAKRRSRTRQWFREGKLFKRTICDEIRLS